MRESDILYENGKHWVTHYKGGYYVFKSGVTHSTRCATIGYKGKIGLDKAISEADRREAVK